MHKHENGLGMPRPPYASNPHPGSAHSDEDSFYNGWSGSMLGRTEPVRGCDIQSKEHGDEICAE